MRGVIVEPADPSARGGGPETLVVTDLPAPSPGRGELLVAVAATAVNRADVLQRKGLYPPPPGAPATLGLELAGTVTALGPDVTGWSVGDTCCAVVAGGGYAELATVPASTAMPLPPGLDLVTAAAVPEVYATAYDNVFLRAGLSAGETVLLHGGSSGVGTAGILLAKRGGATVAVTASSSTKLDACRQLGADIAIDYRQREDFDVALREANDGRGADVVLDIVGGPYLSRNLAALEVEGRMVVIGLMGGGSAEINLAALLSRRLTLMGSTLRARSVAAKAQLAERLVADVWPGFADGSLRPVIHTTMPLEDIAEAHRLMESSAHIGKIVVTL